MSEVCLLVILALDNHIGTRAKALVPIITLFQEDNIFGRVASLTYGPQLTNVGMIL